MKPGVASGDGTSPDLRKPLLGSTLPCQGSARLLGEASSSAAAAAWVGMYPASNDPSLLAGYMLPRR
jgi:hypothetical protein